MPIHPTAVVDSSAEIDATAEIGAYAVVEQDVHVGAETRVYPHAYVATGTTLGRRCQIHPFAVVGHVPQDLKWTGAPSYTRIGDETIIREHATIHRGTMPGSTTVVGQRCFIMATGHIGHNCVVGDGVVIVNGAMLAGHVEVGTRAFVSANASMHQFVRVGELAMIGGGTFITRDVPPFMLVRYPDVILGPNTVGLRRAGLSAAERFEIRKCYRTLYRSGLPFSHAVAQVAEMVQTDAGQRLLQFLQSPTIRGYMRPRATDAAPAAVEEEP
jgi:UDP-N-acetylglucosamine acyltransferase